MSGIFEGKLKNNEERSGRVSKREGTMNRGRNDGNKNE
jgi:hypothetical protein